MKPIEHNDHSYDQPTPSWVLLERSVRQRIDMVTEKLEMANSDTAARLVRDLNTKLQEEGLIGLNAQLITGMPLFLRPAITENGVGEQLVVDPRLLEGKSHEGVFKGCVFQTLEFNDMTLLFYEIEIADPAYYGLRLQAAVDASTLKVAYPETDDPVADEVDGAFAVLETVEDDAYQETVEGLKTAYWNTDQPLLSRIRELGIYATELLAYDAHTDSDELNQALGSILLTSLDEDMHYAVRGFQVEDSQRDSGDTVLAVTEVDSVRLVQPVGIKYLSDFEVVSKKNGTFGVELSDLFQPAFVFVDRMTRAEVAYPMRFISSIEEAEPQTPFAATREAVAPLLYARRFGSSACGEFIHRNL